MKRMYSIAMFAVVVSAMIVAFSCGGEDNGSSGSGSCNMDQDCATGEICNLQTSKCQVPAFCRTSDTCDFGMYCENSGCRSAVSCGGDEDCDSGFHCNDDGFCFPGASDPNACSSADDCGYAQRCVNGRCVDSNTCPEGSQGCACYSNDTCDAGLECELGTCVTGCPVGTEGCACSPLPPRCDSGLACEGGTCVEDGGGTCTEGTLDCPCFANDTCNAGLECEEGVCKEEQQQQCPEGTLDCPCYANNTCNSPLECQSGTCKQPTQQTPMKAKFCNGLSASLTGLAYMCASLDQTSLQANAEACGACVELPASMAQSAPIFDLTDCHGGQSMIGGAQALNGPLDDTLDYIIVLRPDQQLVFLTVEGGQCGSVNYQDAINQANQAGK